MHAKPPSCEAIGCPCQRLCGRAPPGQRARGLVVVCRRPNSVAPLGTPAKSGHGEAPPRGLQHQPHPTGAREDPTAHWLIRSVAFSQGMNLVMFLDVGFVSSLLGRCRLQSPLSCGRRARANSAKPAPPLSPLTDESALSIRAESLACRTAAGSSPSAQLRGPCRRRCWWRWRWSTRRRSRNSAPGDPRRTTSSLDSSLGEHDGRLFHVTIPPTETLNAERTAFGEGNCVRGFKRRFASAATAVHVVGLSVAERFGLDLNVSPMSSSPTPLTNSPGGRYTCSDLGAAVLREEQGAGGLRSSGDEPWLGKWNSPVAARVHSWSNYRST
jgi:hypothetical protein